eukprot:TRINITY_DN3868_c0_g2_i1.p1 TRINITY_DN3868_c0_g2~~TRINITY_DN3868_c0_g2_i1.p1  ORF type:complete len:322 (-),score=40.63 TRINITY_DN3868_c0_g2_i1:3052-3873(-)
MFQFPVVACCNIGKLCVAFVTQTFCTVANIADTTYEVLRVYTILLFDKNRREELLKVYGAQIKASKQLQTDFLNEEEGVEDVKCEIDEDLVAHSSSKRQRKSKDCKLEELFTLNGEIVVDGELAPQVSYRSTLSSSSLDNDETEVSYNSSYAHSDFSDVRSGQGQSVIRSRRSESRFAPIKNSASFVSRISEDDETQNYIEDLQIQVSELMLQSSMVQQLQQRINDLELQRDLLTEELLNTPKDLALENEMLKAQLSALSARKHDDLDQNNLQ